MGSSAVLFVNAITENVVLISIKLKKEHYSQLKLRAEIIFKETIRNKIPNQRFNQTDYHWDFIVSYVTPLVNLTVMP